MTNPQSAVPADPTSPGPAGTATRTQQAELTAELAGLLGLTKRAQQTGWLSDVLRRRIQAIGELTSTEASQALVMIHERTRGDLP